MKLLITGANGMLARDLIPVLDQQGWPYQALTKKELDITDPHQIEARLQTMLPEVLVNCAAYTQVDRAEQEPVLAKQVNLDGVTHLARLCQKFQIKLVHISTDFVFDGTHTEPYVESAPPSPLGVYGATKREGEQAILQQGGDHLIVRTSWLYGVAGNNFVKTMVRLAKERPALKVVDDQIGSPTWTVDLAQALIYLMQVQAEGIFHFSNQGQCSWYEFACAIIHLATQQGILPQTIPVRPIPSSEYATLAKRPAYSVLNCQKYAEVTQQSSPYWEESLQRMLAQLTSKSS